MSQLIIVTLIIILLALIYRRKTKYDVSRPLVNAVIQEQSTSKQEESYADADRKEEIRPEEAKTEDKRAGPLAKTPEDMKSRVTNVDISALKDDSDFSSDSETSEQQECLYDQQGAEIRAGEKRAVDQQGGEISAAEKRAVDQQGGEISAAEKRAVDQQGGEISAAALDGSFLEDVPVDETESAILCDRSAERAEELMLHGDEFCKREIWQKAIGLYIEALEKTPSTATPVAVKILCRLSSASLSNENIEECQNYANDAEMLDPRCTEAMLLSAKANEKSGKFSNAVQDLKRAIAVDAELSMKLSRDLDRLEKRSAEQFEKEKEELIVKMKELGNWALGKVGLSLENFNVIQDPNTGSYNVQYNPPQ